MPSKASQKVAQLRRKSQLRLMDSIERPFQKVVEAQFEWLARALGDAYPAVERQADKFEARLRGVLEHAYDRSYYAATSEWRSWFLQAYPWVMQKNVDTEEDRRERARRFAEQQAAKRVSGITDTVRDKIKSIVKEAVGSDMAPAEIARRLRQEIGDFGKARSETIARTESHTTVMSAQYDASIEAQKEFDIRMDKVWVSTADDRTRETHRDANMQQVPFDQPFKIGDTTLMHPGDPNGDPGEIINCRCTMIETPSTGVAEDQKPVEAPVAPKTPIEDLEAAIAEVAPGIKLVFDEGTRNHAGIENAVTATAEALRDFKHTGYAYPTAIGYTRAGRNAFNASMFQLGNSKVLTVNLDAAQWANPAVRSSMYERGWSSHPALQATIIHEFAHANHSRLAVGAYQQLLPSEKRLVKKYVGEYAASKAREFVAEVFAAYFMGRDFPESILAIYKKYEGPELVRRTP